MSEERSIEKHLAIAEQQLAEAEARLTEARQRVHSWRSIVYGLRQLAQDGQTHLGLDHAEAGDDAEQATGTVVNRSAGPTHGAIEVITSRTRRQPAVERAIQILAEAGRPLQMAEIREEWKRRGWIKRSWKAPDSAINMAYQRALKSGYVGRMPDGAWVLRLSTEEELAKAKEGEGVS